jgi:hypothetical protein
MADHEEEAKAPSRRGRRLEEPAPGEQSAPGSPEAAPAGESRSYSVERLLSESQAFFGHRRATVSGALRLVGGDKEEYSVAEVQAAIDEYLGHEDSSVAAGEER